MQTIFFSVIIAMIIVAILLAKGLNSSNDISKY
jgi:hypothetical protein